MDAESPNIISLILFMGVLGFMPIAAVAATSFAKISVVLLIVRNALGIQQTPPNILIYSVALILTVTVMAPAFREVMDVLLAPGADTNSLQGMERLASEAYQPIRAFLLRFAEPQHKDFFVEAVRKIWAPTGPVNVQPNDLSILVPAFLVSELTRAFEIGFLLYLPFLAVDFVVSAILISLGMQMLSPVIISTPLKVLLFVMVDGWARLLQGLVLSYAVT